VPPNDADRREASEPTGEAVSANAELLNVVYEQLRALAREKLRSERRNHTLQPTALVHEAYLRLEGARPAGWDNPGHFYIAASEAMRRILIEHARARGRIKRSAGLIGVANVEDLIENGSSEDILALEEAIDRVAARDARAAQIVRLRFYSGLSIEEIASALEISPRTVKRSWTFTRAWLLDDLKRDAR
jgi:RNA polymerase sigma factor (TIGR02999 family)